MNSEKIYMKAIEVGCQITQSSWDGGASQVQDDGYQRNIHEYLAADVILESIDLSADSTV